MDLLISLLITTFCTNALSLAYSVLIGTEVGTSPILVEEVSGCILVKLVKSISASSEGIESFSRSSDLYFSTTPICVSLEPGILPSTVPSDL